MTKNSVSSTNDSPPSDSGYWVEDILPFVLNHLTASEQVHCQSSSNFATRVQLEARRERRNLRSLLQSPRTSENSAEFLGIMDSLARIEQAQHTPQTFPWDDLQFTEAPVLLSPGYFRFIHKLTDKFELGSYLNLFLNIPFASPLMLDLLVSVEGVKASSREVLLRIHYRHELEEDAYEEYIARRQRQIAQGRRIVKEAGCKTGLHTIENITGSDFLSQATSGEGLDDDL